MARGNGRNGAIKSAEIATYWEANAETWTRYSRLGYDVYRDALNTPAFLAILPPVSGLCGLDVGCGEGSNTRKLARLGARMHAIDIAPTFIRHARSTEEGDPLGIVFHVADEEREQAAPFRIPRFHRTLSGWVEIICRAGLVIEHFGEPCASPELAKAQPVVADTRVAPLFLHVHARKPRTDHAR
jgi:SAM-dependent methyltransferase